METKTNEQNQQDGYNSTIYTQYDNTNEKTDIKVDNSNPEVRKVIIDKKIDILNKDRSELKECQLDLLDSVYKSSLMGIQSIESIIKEIDSEPLRQVIDKQYINYKDMLTKAIDVMMQEGLQPEKINVFARALKNSAIKLSAMSNRTDSEKAEMIIEGTTMGIIDVYKAFNKCTCDENAQPKPLANEMLGLLRTSIDELVVLL